jgi:hypothetical protein
MRTRRVYGLAFLLVCVLLARFAAAALLVLAFVGIAAPRAAAADGQWQALVGRGGRVAISHTGREVAVASAGLFESGWQGASAVAVEDSTAAQGLGTIRAPSDKMVDVVLQASPVAGGILLHYLLTPRSDMSLNSLHVSFDMPISLLAGQPFTADAERGAIPQQFGSVHLWNGTPRQVQLSLNGAPALELQFAAPQPVLLQDNRQWVPTFSVRIGPQMSDGQVWPAGKPYDLTFTITTAEGMNVDFDEPVTIEAGKDWVPLQAELDIVPGSAVDFSGFGQFDGPAGSHGRVIAAPDGHFAFQDQPAVPRRFYGVNLCFTAQYLPHDQADRLAERLMRLGYNVVRIHHYESSLVDTSDGTSTALRTEPMDQLDYLFAALKKRGIYVTTDLYVSRPVLASEVWPGATGRIAMDDYKMLDLVNQQALKNWETFTGNLLDHRNPYTGMTWAQDPALAWLSMINEGNAGNFIGGLKGRIAEDWQRAWNQWLAKKYPNRAALAKAWGADPQGDPAAGTVPLHRDAYDDTPAGRDSSVFLAQTELNAFQRMRTFIRDQLGCQALLTNMNSWTCTLQTQAVREQFDYVDEHFYVDHPQFLERAWNLPSRNDNASPIAGGATGGRDKTFLRLLDKPFTITEYNYAAPGRFRGVGGIITGCMAALQGWDGLWRFDYSGGSSNLFAPAPVGYFDIVSDPLNQTAERAAIALYLRGDMSEARHCVAIPMTVKELLDDPKHAHGVAPSWNALGLVTRVGTLVADSPEKVAADFVLPLAWDSNPKAWADGAVLADDPYDAATGQKLLDAMKAKGWLKGNVTDLAADQLESENGELLVDAPRDTMVLDTPRTAGGYAPEGGKVVAGPVTVTMDKTYATVWVSSLDDRPIPDSGRLLIAHLTDLQNTGERFGEKARQTLLAWGTLPYLVRDGEATITIKLDGAKAAHVWAIATSGRREAPVDASLKDGTLTVPLNIRGPQGAQLMYEVQVER